jgi:hypothetical protein
VNWNKFFNDYLRIDTKRFPISVKWNSYMYILQQIEWINFRTVEDTRSQTQKMTAPFVISTKWDTYLEWITNWHYPGLRSYFTLKSLLLSELKQVMLTTLTPLARVVLRNDASPSDRNNKKLVCVRGDQCHDHIKVLRKRVD